MTHSLLTCSPYFVDHALHELRRQHPQIQVIDHPTPGHVLLRAPCSFDVLTTPWRHRLPIYLHHLFPVHAIVPLLSSPNSLVPLEPALRRLAPADVTVQVRADDSLAPEKVHQLQEQLQHRYGAVQSLPIPTGRILSVFCTSKCVWMGISWATQNLSPFPGGQLPYLEAVPNRAGYKLLEALHSFRLHLRQGDLALDLGASPGAWTTILRARGLCVTAVAPTPLYPELLPDPGLSFQKMRAEDYLQECRTTFALIVNDMRLDPQDSARLMVAYAPHLRREGIALMTLKLRAEKTLQTMDHAFRILRKQYRIIRVRQLVSNRHEVTLFLRKKE